MLSERAQGVLVRKRIGGRYAPRDLGLEKADILPARRPDRLGAKTLFPSRALARKR